MIKFEFEGIINAELEPAFLALNIENIDILDEDDDGLQIWGIVHNENDLESFKAFFVPHKDMIQNVYVEHQFNELFNKMDTSPSDDENFAVSIGSDDDLESFLAIINK